MRWTSTLAVAGATALAGTLVGGIAPASATPPVLVWDNVGGGIGIGRAGDVLLDGNRLILGGNFITVNDTATQASKVAVYDLSTKQWDTLAGGVNGDVTAIALYQGDLVVAGNFTAAGGVPAEKLAVYDFDTSTWAEFGGGVDANIVNTLEVSGGDLYAGGTFWGLGGANVDQIARWDGNAWSALGTGLTGTPIAEVKDIAVSGTDVYVVGKFTDAGGASVQGAAKWSGSAWSGLGRIATGSEPTMNAVAIDGQGTVWIGGTLGLSTWDGSTRTANSAIAANVNVTALSWSTDTGLLVGFVGSYVTTSSGLTLAQGLARYKDGDWSVFAATTEPGYTGVGTGITNPGNGNTVLKVVGTATDTYAVGTFGHAGSFVSKTAGLARFGPVDGTIPQMTSASISGTATVGSRLTATPNSTAAVPSATFYYTWLQYDTSLTRWVPIQGATSVTFTPDASLLGVEIKVRVRAINNNGDVSEESNSVTVGAAGTAPTIASASAAGTGEVGEVLTASHGAVRGTPTPAVSYRWQQKTAGGAWENIAGATAARFRVTAAQQGSAVRVVVTATNAAGSASATSKAIVIKRAPAPAPGSVTASVKGRTITLAWSAAKGAPVTQYAGRCQRGDEVQRNTASGSARSMSITVPSAGVWACRVAAITSIGRGGSDRYKVTVS